MCYEIYVNNLTLGKQEKIIFKMSIWGKSSNSAESKEIEMQIEKQNTENQWNKHLVLWEKQDWKPLVKLNKQKMEK